MSVGWCVCGFVSNFANATDRIKLKRFGLIIGCLAKVFHVGGFIGGQRGDKERGVVNFVDKKREG